MASLLTYQPDYQFYLVKGDGSAYVLNTLLSCTASLATSSVGQLTATFADPKGAIAGLKGSSGQQTGPQAMDVVQLRLRNRHGEWGVAWTGYVDAGHRLFSPEQGDLFEIQATQPYKLFEVVRQNPTDVVSLGLASARGVTGSAVLTMAANAVGYPAAALVIDPEADSGSFLWGQVNAGILTSPDLQTWSAVLQALVGDSGLEMFNDETGLLYWRRLGYLSDQSSYFMYEQFPRSVQPEEILQSDLAGTDQGVVTEVEVRWGNMPITQVAEYWSAPASMAQQLKTRRVVVYAPWLTTRAQAHFLAASMGQMYAANVLVGTAVIPADPLFRIGHLVDFPNPGDGQGPTRYYLQAVTYSLQWGGPWTMTLGLGYGRAPGQPFPYVGALTYPVPSVDALSGFAQLAGNVPLVPQPTGGAVAANPSLSNTQIALDPALGFAPGTIVTLRDPSTGLPIGPSPNGEYTVVAASAGTGDVFTVASNPTGDTVGVVTTRGTPIGTDATSGSPAPGGGFSAPSTPVTPQDNGASYQTPAVQPGGGVGPGSNSLIFPINPPYSISQGYGPTSFTSEPAVHGYQHFHTGIDIAVPSGTPIFAAAAGVVTFATWDTTGFGYCTIIRSGDLWELYGHQQQIQVSVGQTVSQGQQIGLVDSTGNSKGSHLHFELRTSPGTFGSDTDPGPYLPPGWASP